MKYPKLNFLIIIRFLLLLIFIYVIYYFNNKAITTYEIEVNKNLQIELLNTDLNELERFQLQIETSEKVNNFSSNLYYLFIIILLGFLFVTFFSDKIKLENDRLDKLEGDE